MRPCLTIKTPTFQPFLAIEEQKYIDKNRDMNSINAYTSVEDHKKHISEIRAQHYLENKERILARVAQYQKQYRLKKDSTISPNLIFID